VVNLGPDTAPQQRAQPYKAFDGVKNDHDRFATKVDPPQEVEQTKKITAATSQALQHYRQARAILQQPRRPGGPPPQMMPMPQMDADGMPPVAPVQKSNILTFGIIGGAALVVLLMLRK